MPADCRDCGACCVSDSDEYVPLTAADLARLGEAARTLTATIGGRHYLRMTEGRCGGLRLQAGRLVCAIYPLRPAACRELERGSPACLAEITLKGPVALRLRAPPAPYS